MAKRRKRKRRLGPVGKRVALGVVAAVALYFVADALFGTALRVKSAVRALENDEEGAELSIRNLGPRCADLLESELLAGGREFRKQAHLAEILLRRPFYLRSGVERALESEDAVVCRAAVLALLAADADPERRRAKLADDVCAALGRLAREPADPFLPRCLAELAGYRDDRVPGILIPLALTRPEGGDPLARARVTRSRLEAVSRLLPYAKREGVVSAMREILGREGEPPRIVRQAINVLTAAGRREDPTIFWSKARSEDPFVRQTVADSLADVSDPRVIPILVHLLGDESETVRRAALGTLLHRRAPVVMERIDELAEDWYPGIKIDLALAVGHYRRKDKIPFLVWCLSDYDPEVVRVAHWELVRMTKEHFGFTDEEWREFLAAGTLERAKKIKALVNDEARRKRMIARFSAAFPPQKTDRDRVVPLIRQLLHRDRRNVERAMKELVRITGRREGFPPELIEPGVPPAKQAEASARLMASDRRTLADSWTKWWAEQPR